MIVIKFLGPIWPKIYEYNCVARTVKFERSGKFDGWNILQLFSKEAELNHLAIELLSKKSSKLVHRLRV